MTGPQLRVPVVLLTALVVQLSLFGQVRLRGVRPDALLLVAVAAGIVAGAERGAVVGFLAGLVADLFLETPFGLSAMVFSLVGFAVGSFQTGVLRAAWWIPVVTTVVASAAGVVLYAALGAVVGQAELMQPRLALIAALVGLMNGILSLPAVRVASWASSGGRPSRAYAG